MTKKEVRDMSTENLILILCTMMNSQRVYKYDQNTARNVCEELHARNGDIDADYLYTMWNKHYTA